MPVAANDNDRMTVPIDAVAFIDLGAPTIAARGGSD